MNIQTIIDKFDKEFYQDNTTEKVAGYLVCRNGIKDDNREFYKIALPQDVKQFLKDSLTSTLDGISKDVENKQCDFQASEEHSKWSLCQDLINIINSHR